MDIWVNSNGDLYNLSSLSAVATKGNTIVAVMGTYPVDIMVYKTKQRAQEVFQLIQDHINSIGTNNFNNLPMVYVMPKE